MAQVLGWQPWTLSRLRLDEFEAGVAYIDSLKE